MLAHRLLAAFQAPEAIFAASERELLGVNGLGKGRVARLMDPSALRLAREEIERASDDGVHLVTLADPEYPALLRRLEIHPLVLWVRGRLNPINRFFDFDYPCGKRFFPAPVQPSTGTGGLARKCFGSMACALWGDRASC